MRRIVSGIFLVLIIVVSGSILAVTVVPPKESSNGYIYHSFKQRTDVSSANEPSGQFEYNFEVQDLDGNFVSLEQFKGKPLVIETGSITCPLSASGDITMDRIYEKYDGGSGSKANIILLYTREAHPGWFQGSPENQDEKLELARKLKSKGVQRRILVDSYDGDLHKAIGLASNSSMVIDANGKIVSYTWLNFSPEKTDRILGKLTNTAPDKSTRAGGRKNSLNAKSGLMRQLEMALNPLRLKIALVSGPDAYFDFMINGFQNRPDQTEIEGKSSNFAESKDRRRKSS